LKADVEDEHHNATRFLVMSRQDERAPNSGKVVTTLVFQVRNVPAALYKALGAFATNGVNLTKLESYQLGGSFNATQFYADIQGHPDAPNVAAALKELEFQTARMTVMGVYPAHPYREDMPD
jgi:prephenate dehydratase